MILKASDIALKYGLNQEHFEKFLKDNCNIKLGFFGGVEIEDSDLPECLSKYKAFVSQEIARQKAIVKAQQDKQRALASMLITSGFSFDGYKITRYSGYISGDDAIQIERGTEGIFFGKATDVSQALTDSLVKIRRQALQELKEAAYDLGCNAVIGVDFDYITLEPETATSKGGTIYLPYVFCVTANGNAVVIEKEE